MTVTRGFGQRTLSAARAAPGQSALDALRRMSHVSTSYGGRFVQAIDGLAGDQSQGMAWLYFVNGIQANVGSADYTLHPGDREWWDYRYWNDLIQVPVAIGAWPEPFVHGYGGDRPGGERRRAGMRGRRSGPPCGMRAPGSCARPRRGRCGSRRSPRPPPRSPRASGRAAASRCRSTAAGSWSTAAAPALRPDPQAHALIAGYQPGPSTGRSAEVVVAGDTAVGRVRGGPHAGGEPGRACTTPTPSHWTRPAA